MVHGRGCNPHRCTTTLANLEITSLWHHWWRHNSETTKDREKRRPPRCMKSSELSNGENRIALRQLLQNRKLRHLWRHNLGSRWKLKTMARESISIGVFYNITKNEDNPIKTVGGDSFLSPKTPKNTSVLGVAQPLYSRGHNYTQTYNMCPSLIQIGSKTAEKNSAQTNRQTHTTKIMVTWPWTKNRDRGVDAERL